ncbi:MAG: methyltransferase domain-containing protein [Bradymonadaceae bacterium]
MNRYFGVHVLDGEWHALLPRYLVLHDRLEGKRVLDIGCGTGIGSSLLLELGAERVDGVDYRPGVLDLAKIKHAKESLNFHTMLWEDLDFPDDSFDLVVCLDPAHPVTDPNLLEEVSRVLADDGEYVCAIERRTIAGFESLLPKYGYSAPAENVELGQRDEQAPQIGELTNYFSSLFRILQRPEYNYVFEGEENNSEDREHPGPVDYTLCTEDSHIAGVELIYCGPDEMEGPDNRTIRLPYYRLAERLSTVIQDLNIRQAPGDEREPLGGPVESGLSDETSPTLETEDSTDVRERPDRETTNAESFEGELNRLTSAYRQLQQNFEQLREQTQAAMVSQERSIDKLVQLLHQWRHEDRATEAPAATDGGELADRASTGIYEAPDIDRDELSEATSPETDGDSDDGDALEQRLDRLDSECERLREQREQQQAYIDELEQKLDYLTDGDATETDDEEPSDEDDEPADDAADTDGDDETSDES